MLFPNPVDGPRIVPHGEERLASDKLPNGRAGFRVTQTFASTTGYYAGIPHGAMDVGNFACGDRVLAMAGGRAYAGVDSAGALYVIIDHGNGWKTFYWHLAGWVTVRKGTWVNVLVGQQIGVVGDTGLGAVCHLHIEVHYNGVKRDPWLHLRQNAEASVATFGGADFEHFFANATALKGARVRAEPDASANILAELPYQTALVIHCRVKGRAVGTDTRWYGVWGYYQSRWRQGFAHHVTLESINEVKDGSSLQNKINRAITALEGVDRAIAAGVAALRAAIKALKE